MRFQSEGEETFSGQGARAAFSGQGRGDVSSAKVMERFQGNGEGAVLYDSVQKCH